MLILSVSVWLMAYTASARELKVAFGQEKAPYLWVEDGRIKGIEFDIVAAALAAMGDTLKAGILPNKLSQLHPAGPTGLDYTDFPSRYRQCKFFWVGRADVNVIDRNIFLWYRKQLADEVDTLPEVEYHDILPTIRVRAAFRSPANRDDFNAGLKAIRANGEIERIYLHYGLISPSA